MLFQRGGLSGTAQAATRYLFMATSKSPWVCIMLPAARMAWESTGHSLDTYWRREASFRKRKKKGRQETRRYAWRPLTFCFGSIALKDAQLWVLLTISIKTHHGDGVRERGWERVSYTPCSCWDQTWGRCRGAQRLFDISPAGKQTNKGCAFQT